MIMIGKILKGRAIASDILFSLILLISYACTRDLTLLPESAGPEMVELSADVSVLDNGITRSGIAASDEIEDMCLIGYCEGKLAFYLYSNDTAGLSVKVIKGQTYNLYALANAGKVVPSADEDEFLNSYAYEVSSMADMDSYIPFSWKKSGVYVDGAVTLRIEFLRMVARVWFSIDSSALSGLEVTDVRLCQTPLVMRPFTYAGNKLEHVSDAGPGDHATAADIDLINAGGSACFHTLENCQGKLLPDNSDPWEKVPYRIPDVSELCTYLELDCVFEDGAEYGGKVTYRLYLGEDNVTDFNVRRNAELFVTLTVTEEGFGQVSWKVEADVEHEGRFSSYDFVPGSHIHQYGVLVLPDASADSPVTVSLEGTRIQVTGVAGSSVKVYNCKDEYGNIVAVMTQIPEAPDKVFIYGTLPGERILRLECGMKSSEEVFVVRDVRLLAYSEYSGTNLLLVNERGTTDDLHVYLTDAQTGRVLLLEDFFYPEEYAEWIGEDVDYPVRDFSISMESHDGDGSGTYGYNLVECGLDSGEDYLCSYRYHGLDSRGEDVYSQDIAVIEENSFWNAGGAEFRLDVKAAFPAQRHLGEFMNMQIAPGDLRNAETEIFFGSASPALTSVWDVRRSSGIDDVTLKPDRNMWEKGTEIPDEILKFKYAEYESVLRLLHYYPSAEADGVADFFPCGSMVAKGTVVNPYSGRVVEGYYSFDLVLYMSVGVQVDVETDWESSTLGYSFVPFTEFSTHDYCDFWSDSIFPSVTVSSMAVGGDSGYRRYSTVNVPGAYDDNSIFVSMTEDFNDSSLDASWNQIVNYLYPFRYSLFLFDFCDSDVSRKYDSLELTRDGSLNYSAYGYLSPGNNGYYKIVRQYDVGNISNDNGLENHLLEACYGSFERY